MTYTFTKKQMGLAISIALALGVVSGVARADIDPADTMYATDQAGTAIRSGTGLCWHTGTGPATFKVECDPAPVVAAVEAAPQPAAEPAPAPVPQPVTKKVTLDADTLFDFDKAVLRPAGRAALDDFADKSKEINPETILVVGHADRFGSPAYNQRLSEQRAGSVKTYLVNKGIEPNRIRAEGKGEMEPVTKAGECLGKKSAKVIACLQPDRRVDIEVTGSQIVK